MRSVLRPQKNYTVSSPTLMRTRLHLSCGLTVCLMVMSVVMLGTQEIALRSPAASAANADAAALLAAYRKASGWGRPKSIHTIVAEGEITRQFPTLKSPLLFRFGSPQKLQSLSLTDAANALGPASITTVFGRSAWIRGARLAAQRPLTSSAVSATEANALQVRRTMLEIVLGIAPAWLIEGGAVTVKPAPAERVGNRRQVAAEVSDERGPFGTLLFWEDSGLPARFRLRFMTAIGPPQEAVRTTTFENYRPVDGLAVPFLISRGEGRTQAIMTIWRYMLNKPIPDELFRQPASNEQLKQQIAPLHQIKAP
jgi:hypothetical protein